MKGFFAKHLDPGGIFGEILFGLIMVLTFTLGAGLSVEDGPGAVRTLLIAAIVVGSRNLQHFDAALVVYTLAVVFATWGVTYHYAAWLQKPPTRLYWRRGWSSRPGHRPKSSFRAIRWTRTSTRRPTPSASARRFAESTTPRTACTLASGSR